MYRTKLLLIQCPSLSSIKPFLFSVPTRQSPLPSQSHHLSPDYPTVTPCRRRTYLGVGRRLGLRDRRDGQLNLGDGAEHGPARPVRYDAVDFHHQLAGDGVRYHQLRGRAGLRLHRQLRESNTGVRSDSVPEMEKLG